MNDELLDPAKGYLGALSTEDRRELLERRSIQQRFASHVDLFTTGDASSGIHLVVSGMACRYVALPAGQRQIIGFVLPGDLCDLRGCLLGRADYIVRTLTPLETKLIPKDALTDLAQRSSRALRSFWQLAAVEDATARQWLVNVGHRNAFARTSHLLCEIFTRMKALGLADENSCRFPFTQADIADALALSPVHLNRTLMELRRTGLITLRHQRLTLHDFASLRDMAGFDPAYLSIDGTPKLDGAQVSGAPAISGAATTLIRRDPATGPAFQ